MRNLDIIWRLAPHLAIDDAGCWLWSGPTTTHGGYAKVGGARGHRVTWKMAYGPIPAGMCVLHECDVRRCVNPEHLWLGTQTDNMRDRDAKRRHFSHRHGGLAWWQVAGLPPPTQRIPPERRDEMLALSMTDGRPSLADIASQFGVSTGYLYNLRSKRRKERSI